MGDWLHQLKWQDLSIHSAGIAGHQILVFVAMKWLILNQSNRNINFGRIIVNVPRKSGRDRGPRSWQLP